MKKNHGCLWYLFVFPIQLGFHLAYYFALALFKFFSYVMGLLLNACKQLWCKLLDRIRGYSDPPKYITNEISNALPATGHASNTIPSEKQHLRNLRNYWIHAPIVSIGSEINYRRISSKEKKDFAFISILSAFSKEARDPSNFSGLILSELGITNWNNFVKELLKNGYIQKPDPAQVLSASYSLNDLKMIADSLGIKKTGKKSELAQRISVSLPPDRIEELLKDTDLLIISDRGRSLLVGNEDYIAFYNYRHLISLAEFNDNRVPDGVHRRDFYDTMFHALSNRKFFYETSGDFDNLKLVHCNLYKLLIDESKKTTHTIHYDLILNHYIEYLYLSTCFCRALSWAVKDRIFQNSMNGFFLPQPDAAICKFANYESSINYDNIFFNKPPSLLTYNEFIELVHEMLTAPMFECNKWNSLLKQRATSLFKMLK